MKHDRCQMFKVLGVGTRVRIIELLKSRGPLGAKRIAQMIGVTPAAISQHLRILKQAGLVNSERKGYFIPYEVNVKGLENCCQDLIEVCTCDPGKPARIVVRRSRRASLEELKRHRERLKAELEAVTRKIDEMDTKAGNK